MWLFLVLTGLAHTHPLPSLPCTNQPPSTAATNITQLFIVDFSDQHHLTNLHELYAKLQCHFPKNTRVGVVELSSLAASNKLNIVFDHPELDSRLDERIRTEKDSSPCSSVSSLPRLLSRSSLPGPLRVLVVLHNDSCADSIESWKTLRAKRAPSDEDDTRIDILYTGGEEQGKPKVIVDWLNPNAHDDSLIDLYIQRTAADDSWQKQTDDDEDDAEEDSGDADVVVHPQESTVPPKEKSTRDNKDKRSLEGSTEATESPEEVVLEETKMTTTKKLRQTTKTPKTVKASTKKRGPFQLKSGNGAGQPTTSTNPPTTELPFYEAWFGEHWLYWCIGIIVLQVIVILLIIVVCICCCRMAENKRMRRAVSDENSLNSSGLSQRNSGESSHRPLVGKPLQLVNPLPPSAVTPVNQAQPDLPDPYSAVEYGKTPLPFKSTVDMTATEFTSRTPLLGQRTDFADRTPRVAPSIRAFETY